MIFLPVEIKTRELEARILLACKIVSKGGTVYLGREDVIDFISTKLQYGVFYSKIAKDDLIKRLKKQNHKILWLDEEAGVLLDPKIFLDHRLTTKTARLIDKLCFWTRDQYNYCIKNLKIDHSRAQFTGSVRQDLLFKIKEQRKKNEDRCNKKIIYTSNGVLTHVEKYKLCNDLDALHTHISRNASKILIRKHPSEKIECWEKIILEFNTLELESGGKGINDILRTADIIIHNGSTVSIDSALSGLKSIKYVPPYITSSHLIGNSKDRGDSVCHLVNCFDDLVLLVNQLETNFYEDQSQTLSQLGYYVNGDSADKITDEILLLDKNKNNNTKAINLNKLLAKSILREPAVTIKSIIRNSFLAKYLFNWRDVTDKCDVITLDEINEAICSLEPGLVSTVKVIKVNRNLFKLSTI